MRGPQAKSVSRPDRSSAARSGPRGARPVPGLAPPVGRLALVPRGAEEAEEVTTHDARTVVVGQSRELVEADYLGK